MTDPTIQSLVDPDQIRRDLEIQALDINTAMIRQPALFAHYSVIAARADRLVNKYKQFVDITEAKIDREIRGKAIADGTKVTEAQVKSLVQLDARMQQIQACLNEATEQSAIAKSTAEAFRHRRDMLIQVAFNYREENKGTMGVQGDPNARAASSVREARVAALRAVNNEQD